MKAIFDNRKSGKPLDKQVLVDFVERKATHMNTSNLVALFYSMACANVRMGKNVAAPMARALTNVNKKQRTAITLCTDDLLTPTDIGKLFFGLRSFDSHSPDTFPLIKTLAFSVRALRNTLGPASGVSSRPPLSSRTIGSICYSLMNLSTDHPEVRELVAELTKLISSAPNLEPLSNRAIGNALYGMKNFTSDSPEALALLETLCVQVETSPSLMEGVHTANALFGLKGMDSTHPEVRRILLALVNKMDASCVMTPKEVCMSLHGLVNMNSHHVEVRRLLEKLTPVLAALPLYSIDSVGTSVALYGLRNMHSEHVEVRGLIQAIADISPASISTAGTQVISGFTDASHMSNSLYGLQSMSGDHREVLALVDLLTHKIKSTTPDVEMSGVHLSAAIYGLKGLPSCCDQVRELLKQLTWRVSISHNLHLSTSHFQNMLFGLQNMSSAQSEVRNLISALLTQISQQEGSKLKQESRYGHFVASCLYGMREMSSDYDEVRAILATLLKEAIIDGNGTEADTRTAAAATFSPQEISNALYGLQGMSSQCKEVREIISMLTESLAVLDERREAGDDFISQGKGMCVYGIQQMTLEHDEVRNLLSALMRMLTRNARYSDFNSTSSSPSLLSYKEVYMINKSWKRDEHILGGLMLSLYGVASLHQKSFSSDGVHPSSTKCMSDMFSKLHGEDRMEDVSRSYHNNSYNEHKDRNEAVVYDMLRAIRESFAEEEDVAFKSFAEFEPFTAMKSVLNLRRNVNMLLYFLGDECHTGQDDVLMWLHRLVSKCEGVFDGLKKDQHMVEICDFNDGDIALSIPFEFRKEGETINDLLKVVNRPQMPTGGARLGEKLVLISPAQLQCFLDETPCRNERLTAEGMTFNTLLRNLVGNGECGEIETEPVTVHTNLLGNVSYISNSSLHRYDICLTHNEVLHGVDTDIVVRLYERLEDSPRLASQLASSFSHPPVQTFNVEVDGPYHSYHKKQRFKELRDKYLLSRRSSLSILTLPKTMGDVSDGPVGGNLDIIRLKFDNDVKHFSPEELKCLVLGEKKA